MKNTDKLIAILQSYTQDLKVDYIEKCKIFAEENYNRSAKWLKTIPQLSTKKWFDFFNVESKEVTYGNSKFFATVPDWNNQKKAHAAKNKVERIQKLVGAGLEATIATAEKHAIRHYNDSLAKLAYRIETKGMNIDNMKVVKSGIGVNIEIVLSDNAITVKAWTIVASGPIKQPHYRYLVK